MTYIELLNDFWDSTRFNPCSSNEATMYFYLLHQCNIRRWINPFELKTKDFEIALEMNRQTLTRVRNKLKERGLINFSEGKGKGPAIYLICGAKINDKDAYKKLVVTSCDNKRDNKRDNKKLVVTSCDNKRDNKRDNKKLVVTSCDNKRDDKCDNKCDNKPVSTLYKEEIRYKTKDISPDGDIARAREEHSLFEEEEKKNQKSKTTSRPKPPEPPPPTFDEVKAYFLSQRADERLEDWERETEIFFNHFTSLGWKTSSGAKVSRWDSRANLWIIEHEKKPTTEKPKTDEAGKADKLSERRGSDSGAKSRKGFKGTF